MERLIISFNQQSFKIKVGPSPILNEEKRSDKIQMPGLVGQALKI